MKKSLSTAMLCIACACIALSGSGCTFLSSLFNKAPVASDVLLSGAPVQSRVLTGDYSFSDEDEDAEGDSTYQWYRAVNAEGSGAVAIAGAASATYTLTLEDVGYYFAFEVTPISADGTAEGDPVRSSFTAAAAISELMLEGGFAALCASYVTAVLAVAFEVESGEGWTLAVSDTTVTLTLTDCPLEIEGDDDATISGTLELTESATNSSWVADLTCENRDDGVTSVECSFDVTLPEEVYSGTVAVNGVVLDAAELGLYMAEL